MDALKESTERTWPWALLVAFEVVVCFAILYYNAN